MLSSVTIKQGKEIVTHGSNRGGNGKYLTSLMYNPAWSIVIYLSNILADFFYKTKTSQ